MVIFIGYKYQTQKWTLSTDKTVIFYEVIFNSRKFPKLEALFTKKFHRSSDTSNQYFSKQAPEDMSVIKYIEPFNTL